MSNMNGIRLIKNDSRIQGVDMYVKMYMYLLSSVSTKGEFLYSTYSVASLRKAFNMTTEDVEIALREMSARKWLYVNSLGEIKMGDYDGENIALLSDEKEHIDLKPMWSKINELYKNYKNACKRSKSQKYESIYSEVNQLSKVPDNMKDVSHMTRFFHVVYTCFLHEEHRLFNTKENVLMKNSYSTYGPLLLQQMLFHYITNYEKYGKYPLVSIFWNQRDAVFYDVKGISRESSRRISIETDDRQTFD